MRNKGIFQPTASPTDGLITEQLRLGAEHHQAGRLQEAEKVYRAVLALDPTQAMTLRLLGGLCVQKGDNGQGLDYLQQALAQTPNRHDVHHNIASAWRNLRVWDRGLAHSEAALRLKPDYTAAQISMAHCLYHLERYQDSVAWFHKASLVEKDKASLWLDYGNALRKAGRVQEAMDCYDKSEKLAPNNAELLMGRGAALWDMARLDEALACYDAALALKPGDFNVLVNMGTTLWSIGRTDDALDVYGQVLSRDPEHSDALTNCGVVYLGLGQDEVARDYFQRALDKAPAHPNALWNMALIKLADGDYVDGWRLYETGLRMGQRGVSLVPYKQAWDGSDIRGKRLLVWGEQGLGDSLQFIRYAQLCKQRGATIHALMPAPLQRLFKQCPYLDFVSTSVNPQDFDEHISVMSLPHRLGTTLETVPANIPYLFADPADVSKWENVIPPRDGRLRIGLVWAGSPRKEQLAANIVDQRRSMRLKDFLPLFDVPGVQIFNLQFGELRAEIAENGLADRMVDLMPQVRDFADTAALVQHLDLVISVDTSTAHLVGGLGKPIWILSRYDACWRWLRNRPDSPWYPTARIFGQRKPSDWPWVVEQVTTALRTFSIK
ncbi:MAG: glycosyltransferase family protein [Alphaproteobacteria bacterium]|nr:glycosyltransferase family protein [Alphaproteobacteria bacterium]